MNKAIANVRNIRRLGKSKLVKISDQMNNLAWELSEKNEKVGDKHTAKSIAMLDESLSLMQRSLGLLNSVAIDHDLLIEAPVAEKKSSGLFAKKTAAADATPDAAPAAMEEPFDRAPIASIKPQA